MTKAWLIALVLVAGCKKKQEAPPAPPQATAADAAATAPAPALDAAATVEVDAAAGAAAGSADGSAGSAAGSAAALSPEAQEALCVKVLGKLYACRDDQELAAALTAGASAEDKQRITKFIKAIKDWPRNFCTYEYNYEYPGFSEHWDKLTAPEILESCGKLGAAVKDAGGLFGGDVAK